MKMEGEGACAIIAHKLARAIHYMLRNSVPFNLEKYGNSIDLEGQGAARHWLEPNGVSK